MNCNLLSDSCHPLLQVCCCHAFPCVLPVVSSSVTPQVAFWLPSWILQAEHRLGLPFLLVDSAQTPSIQSGDAFNTSHPPMFLLIQHHPFSMRFFQLESIAASVLILEFKLYCGCTIWTPKIVSLWIVVHFLTVQGCKVFSLLQFQHNSSGCQLSLWSNSAHLAAENPQPWLIDFDS